jgi:hypothetical protein
MTPKIVEAAARELADRADRFFGCSHDAWWAEREVRDGIEVIKRLREVLSVDLVADPATTNRGLFESRSFRNYRRKESTMDAPRHERWKQSKYASAHGVLEAEDLGWDEKAEKIRAILQAVDGEDPAAASESRRRYRPGRLASLSRLPRNGKEFAAAILTNNLREARRPARVSESRSRRHVDVSKIRDGRDFAAALRFLATGR